MLLCHQMLFSNLHTELEPGCSSGLVFRFTKADLEERE